MKKRVASTVALVLCLLMAFGPAVNAASGLKSKELVFKASRGKPTPKTAGAGVSGKANPVKLGGVPAVQSPVLLPGQSATLMPDGRFILIGGVGPRGPLASAELRDRRNGSSSTVAGKMRYARAGHSATMLPDGNVLIFGGIGADGQVVEDSELFNASTQRFEIFADADLKPRAYHSATLLLDGRILIAGGMLKPGRPLDKVELLDPRTKSVENLSVKLQTARRKHTATLLSDGRVLLWKGAGEGDAELADGEVYDPDTQSLSWVGAVGTVEDGAAPYLTASLPSDGAADVPVDGRLALRFSKPLRAETVTTGTITLTGSQGAVAAKVVPAENGMLAFLTPNEPLQPGVVYTASLSGAADRNDARIAFAAISFTTKPEAAQKQNGLNDEEWIPNAENFRGKWRSKHVKPKQTHPPLQAAPGVTALSGRVLALNDDPLPNVTLQIDSQTTKTDHAGRFLLASIAPGRQVLKIDGRTASRRKATYGVFRVGVPVAAGKTNVLPYTIWMPKIDLAHAITVRSPTPLEVVLTNPLIPGLELRLPRGTVIRDTDGQTVTQLSITPIPTNQPPFPLPPGIDVPTFFTIQPGGARVIPPRARLIYPNFTKSRPGARIDFWNYDADEKGWYIYGRGTVTADGRQIVPDPGVVLYEFSGAMVSSPSNSPQKGPPPCDKCQDGDPVDLNTGLFVYTQTDLALANAPTSLSLTRTYRQSDSISRPFGIGTTHPYEMFLVGDTFPYTYMDLILQDGGRVHFDRVSSGTGYSDAVYEHTGSPSAFYKARLEWVNDGGGWSITLQDGSVFLFPESDFATTPRQAALIGMRDRFGNALTLTRNTDRDLTRISAANGRWIEFTYDTQHRITQAEDNSGRTVGYTYDAGGRLWKVTDPNAGVTEYTYDTDDQMLTVKDQRGVVFLTNEYDADGRVQKQTQADDTTFQFAYTENLDGKVVQTDVTDPRGIVRRVTFNTDGYTLTDTYAVGKPEQQTFTYERQAGTNLLLSLTDPLGRKTAYAYDSHANATTITRLADTSGAVSSHSTYDSTFDVPTNVTDQLNHSVSFDYDAHGNLSSVTDPLNHQARMTYNAAGQLTSVTDPLDNTVRLRYEAGDLAMTTDQEGHVTERIVDTVGRLILVKNPQGNTTRYVYDALNRMTQTTDPLGGVTSFTYDPIGNLLTVTDARNNTLTNVYDDMGRLTSRTDQLLKTNTYEYDEAGNLTRATDRRGKVTVFNYDNLSRRTFVGSGMTVQGGTTSYESTLTFTYDAANRITQVVDSVAGTIDLAYDGLDRLTGVTAPQGTVSYTYDAAGRRQTMTVTGQPTVSYTYDAADRVTGITQGTASVAFAYDNANRLTGLTLPNGVVAEYAYDRLSQVTSITYTKGATTLGDLTYEYDGLGKRIKAGGTLARTNLPDAFGSATYNEANQLTQKGSTSFTYDDNGNLLTDGVNTYTWDARNRLASISGGAAATFQYDAFGKRIGKTINSTTTDYLYDGANVVQELSGGTPTANFLNGGLDRVFMRTDGAGARTLLTDALGSTLALTDSSGNVQTEYTYDPFGKTSVSGTASGNASQYTGRESDGTGLYYYRARYYSPALQRFISQDPIGLAGGINMYAYVENDPLGHTDPSGLDKNSGADDLIDALENLVDTAFDNLKNMIAMAAMINNADIAIDPEDMVQPYEVGEYNDLMNRPRNALDQMHHVVQTHPGRQVIPEYSRGSAPAIALPRIEHARIPNLRGPYSGTPRDLLARDIKNLRKYTDAPNSALEDLIKLNKLKFPKSFCKL